MDNDAEDGVRLTVDSAVNATKFVQKNIDRQASLIEVIKNPANDYTCTAGGFPMGDDT